MRTCRRILLLAVFFQAESQVIALEWLYVTLNNNTVARYDVSLGSSALVAASANTVINSNLSNPWGISRTASGEFLVANGTGNTISRYDSDGVYQGNLSGNGLSFPVGLAIDASGIIYVANFTSAVSTITTFNADYSFRQTFTGNMSSPYGLAINSTGLVYVANQASGTNTVSIFNSSGVYQGNVSTNVASPTGLTFDSSGNLYVANNTGNAVTKYNSANSYLSNFTGNISSPRGVQTDSLGNLYVANATGNTISKFNSAGTFQFSWGVAAQPRMMIIGVPEASGYVMAGIAAILLGLLIRRRRDRVLTA